MINTVIKCFLKKKGERDKRETKTDMARNRTGWAGSLEALRRDVSEF